MPQRPLFLGGHPMAGKERSGLDNADARLFENARYVLTPFGRKISMTTACRRFAPW